MAASPTVTIEIVRVRLQGTRAHVEYRVNGSDETKTTSVEVSQEDDQDEPPNRTERGIADAQDRIRRMKAGE